jgi:membrane-bound serine protease (ClpP class)
VDTPAFLTDPNFVYTVLWLGLWIAVTVAHTPGTGVIEGLALIALGGAALMLLSLPTNWLSVLILVAGVVGFILIPFIKQQYTTLSLGGLILQGVGGYFLFDGLSVSLLVLGMTIVVSLAYHFFFLLPAIKQVQLHKWEDRDHLVVGAEGRVVKALDPIGTVQVNSELWTASSNKTLPAGTTVTVLERNGLQLYVESSKDKREPTHEIENQDILT